MARLSLVLLIVVNFALIFQATCFEARKVLMNLEKEQVPSSKYNFVGISTLPSKEHAKMIPANDGDNKGHAMANNERLFPIHLAKIGRVLQSRCDSCGTPPSPGQGNH